MSEHNEPNATTYIGTGGPNSHQALFGNLASRHATDFRQALANWNPRANPPKTASLWDEPPRGLIRMPKKQREANREKYATLAGGPNTSELERGFAQIAETYITDKAPLLTNYMLGFQLLKKTDDDTKACGIFAYKVGDELVYIPVFVINGDVQGHELMYVVSKDQFVPSDEKWVNFLLSRKPLEPGRIERRERSDIPTQGTMRPSYMSSGLKLSSYTQMPTLDPVLALDALKSMFKQASVGTSGLNRSFWRDVAETQTRRIPLVSWKAASCATEMELTHLFRRSYKATKLASQWSHDYPVFGRLLNYAMDGASLDPFLNDWQKRAAVARQLGVVASAPKSLQQKLQDRFPQKTAAIRKEGTVAVYGVDRIPAHQFRFMPTALIDRIHQDGYYVADARDQTKLASIVIDANSENIGLCNPVGPGRSKVYMADGTFQECFLFQEDRPGRSIDPRFIVVNKKTGCARTFPTREIWVSGPSSDPKWIDKIPESTAELRTGKDYDLWDRHRNVLSLLITPAGIAWVGKFVENGDTFYEEDDGTTVNCTSHSLHGFKPMCAPGEDRYGCEVNPQSIPVICHQGTILRRYKDPDRWHRGQSDDEIMQLGTRQLWMARLMENTTPIRVRKVERAFSEYAIDDEMPKVKSAALETLMVKHNLSLGNADALIKEADIAFPRNITRYREKTAFSGEMPRDKYSVTFPQKETTTDGVTGLQIEQDLQTEEQVEALRATKVPDERMTWPGMPDAETNQSMGSPPAPNASDINLASQAAQSGQKDFVSSQMLLSLLREIDNDDIIPKYINTFEKSCDMLGRLYMQLLWRTDAFEERFGKTQLKEFKEMLVNLFQQMGDFICYLRQRDIRPAVARLTGGFGVPLP
jgi:hypothetical protein